MNSRARKHKSTDDDPEQNICKKKKVCKKAKSTDDDPELNVCFIKIHEVGVEGECDTLSLFHTEILKVKGICN